MDNKLTVESLSHILYGRLYAYDLLRRFFLEEPSQDYLKYFVEQEMIRKFPFVEDSTEIAKGVSYIESYLAKYDPVNKEADFEALHWDYTRMLIGPFDLPVPPWESVYLRADKLLFQSHTMDVRKRYEHFGFEVKDYNIEADDHIGLQLDFMYHLTNLAITSAEENKENTLAELSYLLKNQEEFLQDHLMKFAPQLADKMVESAETTFYKGFARILKAYLKVDLQVLEELLNIEITK